MKKMLCVIASLVIFVSLSAQQFQTIKSGNITDKSIFQQRPLNGGKWQSAVDEPFGYVTVNRGDTLIVNVEYNGIDSLVVKTGGVLIINARLYLLVPVINKGGKILGDITLIQLPLTTVVLDNSTTNLFNVYSVKGIVKVNASTYGDLQIVSYWGTLAFANEIPSEGYYEFTPNLHSGIYLARFKTGDVVFTKKFVYNK